MEPIDKTEILYGNGDFHASAHNPVATVVSIKASRRADQDAEKRFALVTAAKQFSTASVDLTRHARSYASTLNTAFFRQI